MTLTTVILRVLALYMMQIFLQEASRFGFDVRGIVGDFVAIRVVGRSHVPRVSGSCRVHVRGLRRSSGFEALRLQGL
jgi:hypothetical protein